MQHKMSAAKYIATVAVISPRNKKKNSIKNRNDNCSTTVYDTKYAVSKICIAICDIIMIKERTYIIFYLMWLRVFRKAPDINSIK